MEIIEATTTIDAQGHLNLNLPTHLTPGKVKVSISIQPITDENPATNYDFSDLVGQLRWQGEAIALQRRLRNEW